MRTMSLEMKVKENGSKQHPAWQVVLRRVNEMMA